MLGRDVLLALEWNVGVAICKWHGGYIRYLIPKGGKSMLFRLRGWFGAWESDATSLKM
jgi:hypothetical protein